MYNIMLVCSAGMSTSLLVNKMKDYCAKEGIEANIWADASAACMEDFKKADCVLVGPQARMYVARWQKENPGIKIEVIDMRSYGQMNGEAVVKQGIALINK